MTQSKTFRYYFLHSLWKIRAVIFWLLVILVADAVVIAYFEKMPFADALYFTFVTGLTIGYGDIAPVTFIGRVVAILAGFQGMLISGLIIAVAVYALRRTMKNPTEKN
jgi:hypothetical protein